MLIVITFYFILRVQILYTRSDTAYLTYISDSYFKSEAFTSDDGFNIAFGLSAYDNEAEWIEDEDYGSLKAYHYRWGFEGEHGSTWTEIPSRNCTRKEFYLDDVQDNNSEETRLYRDHFTSESNSKYYWRKFRCTDERIEIIGDYDSTIAQQFVIQFEKCDNATRSTCKTEDEIIDFLKEKYIITRSNNRRFLQDEFSDPGKIIINESRLKWIPISSQIRQIVPFSIKVTDLEF